MTQIQLQNEIETKALTKHVRIGEENIPHVALLTFKSNYIQVLYDYGIDVLLVILEVLEYHQIYEQCAVIKQTIENYNELEGTSFTTTYREDE